MQRISWTVSGATVSCTGSDGETQKNGSEETMAYYNLADSLVEVVSFPAPEKLNTNIGYIRKNLDLTFFALLCRKKVYH